MEQPIENKVLKTADKKAYMRDYMRTRYNNDLEGSRCYAKALKCKIRFNLSETDFKEYGIHLADIHKLKQLQQKLPPELFAKALLAEL